MEFDPLQAVARAQAAGVLSDLAAERIRAWLVEPAYAAERPELLTRLAANEWPALDAAFRATLPFGTGGRRGRMYPVGPNAINDRTMAESAWGAARYVRSVLREGRTPRAAVGFDTRHGSRRFATVCAEVLLAEGFEVVPLDEPRATPQLAFAVRAEQCDLGLMISASHNPPSDNAIKVYWADGGQIVPPHDARIIAEVARAGPIARTPLAEGRAAGRIIARLDALDAAYAAAVAAWALPGPRGLRVLFSPLHGTGGASVVPALRAAGFADVECYGPQSAPDGDFPNVPGHVANPENPAVMATLFEAARAAGADLALVTDPDADRLGVAAPRADGSWEAFNGQQLAALVADHALSTARERGSLGRGAYVVKTLVTTPLVERIAAEYGADCVADLPVGFKWIGQEIERRGPEGFIAGVEESHGYLVGTHVRDKDAAAAAVVLCDLAARLKPQGQSLHDRLDALERRHGCHAERLLALDLDYRATADALAAQLDRWATRPPAALGGLRVARVRDYRRAASFVPGGPSEPFTSPVRDLVWLELDAPGHAVALRPSGTEPKWKAYLRGWAPPDPTADLSEVRAELWARLDAVARDVVARVQGEA